MIFAKNGKNHEIHFMNELEKAEILRHFRSDNPWWTTPRIPTYFADLSPRPYLSPFLEIVLQEDFHRSVVLLGPRRVGKTVLLHHTIQQLLLRQVAGNRILYISLETRAYRTLNLEQLLIWYLEETDQSETRCYVIFDEVQYQPEWEVDLKSLTDRYRHIQFIVSGSAAAALVSRSRESGAGRFTEFKLPPLTFHEYLTLKGLLQQVRAVERTWKDRTLTTYAARNVQELNTHFINYLNYGGYPETAVRLREGEQATRYLGADVVGKAIARDIPILYGISNVNELERLFATLTYNTGNEVNLEVLSRDAGLSKPTLTKYLDFLEESFLIKRIHRVDITGKRFKQIRNVKIYVTNPTLYAAMFLPVRSEDHQRMGQLVETAIVTQWYHRPQRIAFARWNYARGKSQEVDIVGLYRDTLKPSFAVEAKWSNRPIEKPSELVGLVAFAKKNKLDRVILTTINQSGTMELEGVTVEYLPAAVYCYTVGRRSFEETR